MAAPSYAALYQFEEQLEDGFKSVLQTVSGLDVRQTRDDDAQATPRCVLRASVGGCAGGPRLGTNIPGGQLRPDLYDASITVDVFTNRRSNEASHATILGQIRAALYEWSNFTTTRFPYLVILKCHEDGNSGPGLREGENDSTGLTFTLSFGIRHDAWPV